MLQHVLQYRDGLGAAVVMVVLALMGVLVGVGAIGEISANQESETDDKTNHKNTSSHK